MAFLLIGLLLLASKWLELGPAAGWSWWWVLSPFAMAVAWWAFADATGITQRRAMRRHEENVARRKAKSVDDLGLGPSRDRRAPRDRQPPVK
jgi:small Trp-rich protein